MSFESAAIRASTLAACAGVAIWRTISICSCTIKFSVSLALLMSLSAACTTLISLSVTPALADTIAIVGAYEPVTSSCRFDSATSRSLHSLYSAAVASEAPPNLCTSHLAVLDAGIGAAGSSAGVAATLMCNRGWRSCSGCDQTVVAVRR
eukprot:jgi/Chrpa1/5589/Chrysochromulina_OHIO_Genome00005138-RA